MAAAPFAHQDYNHGVASPDLPVQDSPVFALCFHLSSIQYDTSVSVHNPVALIDLKTQRGVRISSFAACPWSVTFPLTRFPFGPFTLTQCHRHRMSPDHSSLLTEAHINILSIDFPSSEKMPFSCFPNTKDRRYSYRIALRLAHHH